MRVFCISDIHIDFEANLKWLKDITDLDHTNDILLLAGDICHDYNLFKRTLVQLKQKFNRMFFTPGNHDLWLRNGAWPDSLYKFEAIMEFCESEDIDVSAGDIQYKGQYLRIIPLHSWYTRPGEGNDNLYWPKPGEDETNRMWSDNYYVSWPDEDENFRPVEYLLNWIDEPEPDKKFHQVITMSHFIPRKEMMFGEYPPKIDIDKLRKYDRTPEFNFSRVAGSSLIDQKLRQYGSTIHVYGHQHINRDRIIDGVRYVSHCLGYPKERNRGQIRGLEQGLKLIYEY